MTTKKRNPQNEIGEQVAAKISEQHLELTQRNWPEIQRVMDEDEDNEVKITFATIITNRPAEPGTVASKDSRIKTTMSMPLGKLSDAIDSPYPLAHQPELTQQPADPA